MSTGSTICFYSQAHTEVLRLSKNGITANPEIPVDEAAKLVLAAIDSNIKFLVQKAVEDEREACAIRCEHMGIEGYGTLAIAAAIRARRNP